MSVRSREHSHRIADIHVRLRLPEELSGFSLTEIYEAFRYSGPEPPDLAITIRLETPPPTPERPLFSPGSVWQIYERNGTTLIATTVPREGGGFCVDRLGIFAEDFRSGELYLPPESYRPVAAADGTYTSRFPLTYPMDELIFIHLLSKGRGLELHGCGVSMNGEGLLFIGTSGSGKSTMGRLMGMRPNVVVLSDDRIIVRQIEGRWRMFGTPWHGTARAFSPARAELKKIFVLRHAAANDVRPLSRVQGASMLVARSFPTYWDPAGMEFTLNLVSNLSDQIPIYELGFAPTPACVDFVRGV